MTNPKGKPASGRVIDLDQARVARSETEAEPVELKIGGKTFKLPAEVPADYSLFLAEGEIRKAVGALFNSNADAFFATNPSVQDLNELMEQLEKVYGAEPGE